MKDSLAMSQLLIKKKKKSVLLLSLKEYKCSVLGCSKYVSILTEGKSFSMSKVTRQDCFFSGLKTPAQLLLLSSRDSMGRKTSVTEVSRV